MNTLAHDLPSISHWRGTLAALLALLAGTLLLYRETALAMVAVWARSDTFAHGFLVPPIVLWLIWRKRVELAAASPRPAPWLLLPLAAAALLWLLGDLAAVSAASQLALVAMLVLAATAVLGLATARVILFPLAFLFFAAPVGEFMLPRLMEWTAAFTVSALRASGVPVYQEGLEFVIPTGKWSVVEACSGLRYLIPSLMAGTLFAYLNYRSWQRRWLFVAVSIVVPIVANWLRAYLIVMLGHLSGNQYGAGVDHLIYGWLFFGVVMLLMFLVGARWTESPAHRAATTRVPRVAFPAGWSAATVAAIALLLSMPHVALQALSTADVGAVPPVELPSQLAGGWQARADLPTAWVPAYKSPSALAHRSYGRDDEVVGVYVAYYRRQLPGSKLISSTNALVSSQNRDWVRVSSGSHTLQLSDALRVSTAQLRRSAAPAESSDTRLLVWQVYWVSGRLTDSDLEAKWYGTLDRLLGRGDDAAVVLMYTPLVAPDATSTRLEGFARLNLSRVIEQIARADDAR